METKTKGIGRLTVSAYLVASLWSGRYEVIRGALPSDGKIVDIGIDHETQNFWIDIESESYPTDEGVISIPPVLIQRITDLADTAASMLETSRTIDPACINTLFNLRRPCSEAIANHPSIIVGSSKDETGWSLGFLGLLNGILAETGNQKRVAMKVDEQGNVVGFLSAHKSEFEAKDAESTPSDASPVPL